MQVTANSHKFIFSVGEKKIWLEYYTLLVIYRIILDSSYVKIIYPIYGYSGFDYRNNPALFLLSWFVLLILARVVRTAYKNVKNKISFEIVFLLYLMSFVPFTSMMAFGALEMGFIISNITYWVLLLFFILHKGITRNRRSYKLTTGPRILGHTQLIILTLFLGVVTIYVSGRYAHFRLNFNLLGVYELRAEARNNSLPTLLVYLFAWGKTINAILIAYFIRRKKYKWTAFCAFVELLSFGYDGSKSTFFLLLLAVGINLLPRTSLEVLNKWVLRGFVVLVFGCFFCFMLTSNFVPASIMVRRVLFLPVQIAGNYYDFFSNNSPDFFRQSFLRYIGLSSNYEQIPYMIGRLYYNAPSMSANNGLISDAMANFGYPGILIYPVIISTVFRWLDNSAKGLDHRIYVTVAVYVALVMTNSFFTTILLTHGLLVTVLVLSLMKRDKKEYHLTTHRGMIYENSYSSRSQTTVY